MRRDRVAIVGGGLAGLTAAAVAARRGAEVVVFEARETVGGRARSRVRDGVVFNQGPHGLNPRHGAIEVLAELGVTVRGTQPRFGGAYGRLRGSIGLLPSTPRDAIRSRLVGLRAKAQLASVFSRPQRLLRSDRADRSLQEWIDEHFSDADARAIAMMTGRLTTYVEDLTTLDATAGINQIVAALTDGVLYVDGGWQQLVDALRDAAEQAGVKIVTDHKVDTLADLDSSGSVVLAAGGPHHAARLCDGASPIVDACAEQARPIRATSLDLALRRLPQPERRACMGVDEPFYCSVHTPSAMAAEGVEVLHALRYGDAEVDPRPDLEAFLDDAQPGWRREVVDEQYGRRLIVSYDRPGLSSLRGRAPVSVADLHDVYLAGDWVGSEGMLADAAVLSGRAAALAATST